MLKKLSLLITSGILFSGLSEAQFPTYLIPDSLKENAHCIVRDYLREIEVNSINSATENISKVITVFDKKGEENAILMVPYDKNSSVTIKKVVYYDKNGNKLKNGKLSEIQDHPFSGNSELYSETRVKLYTPANPEYPYTIEYEYNLRMDNVISYGCWRPFNSYNISAQHVKLILTRPKDIKINIRESGIQKESSEIIKNRLVEIWEMNNVNAYGEEPFGISLTERIPCVYMQPDKILYDNYEGSASNWTDFGKWVAKLYSNRDELSESEKVKISKLVQGKKDTIECIQTLYDYLQKNTRYVAITLGIGGFQPSNVKSVIETGFGDCKALTNYMYSLLKYAGIKSYPALVASGTYQVPVFSDFPNFQQFDHVILCVPISNDTIWLECTNQKLPFGFLGDFTDDRSALLFTEAGGKFAHTRRYDANDNLRTSSSTFVIDSEGNASLTSETFLSGLQYDNMAEFLNSNYEEQKKWLQRNSDLPALKINSFSIEEGRKSNPWIRINESSVSNNYCTFSGKYMLMPVNKINVQDPISKMLKPRSSDIILHRSYIDTDTTIYTIPSNMVVESIPLGKNISADFGEYSYSISTDGNKITYIRRFLLKEGRYEPGAYTSLYNFILEISKLDNIKILLTKKT